MSNLNNLFQNVTDLNNLDQTINTDLNDITNTVNTDLNNIASIQSSKIIEQYLPPYIDQDAWQPWDANGGEPCPAGFTCAKMGNNSFGAFSCDELARLAVDQFGFGNVLGGTYCPEGEEGVYNCPIGSYCPDTKTQVECPAGVFCPFKTQEPTFDGGSVKCDRCPPGAQDQSLTKSELRGVQIALLVVLLLILIVSIVKHKITKDKEKLKNQWHIQRQSKIQEAKKSIQMEEKKYERLRPKLEVIANRLSNLSDDDTPQDADTPQSPGLKGRTTTLYISMGKSEPALDADGTTHVIEDESGHIVFDADRMFERLDEDKNGQLDFEEINKVLCLDDKQLRAFINSMHNRMPEGFEPNDPNTVSRSTFTKCFLDALADASDLQPTKEEAEEIFNQIVEEVGTLGGDEVEYSQLYHSYLSTFLSDEQIYGIISCFKKGGVDGENQKGTRRGSIKLARGITREDFINNYPQYLSNVTTPGFSSIRRATMMSMRVFDFSDEELAEEEEGGLDVAFENLSLTVKVGKNEKVVVNEVSGRLMSNTMTALMGGSGCGKSSLLNALCGRAFYGKTTGKVWVNGNDSKIENHKSSIGFVPQEDIVFADLTVRENLIYAGRLYLPKGTSEEDIAELADATMASLGLSRIAQSPVGDATKRGVSGGEKKRVNIGIELMKRPKILFLDEPTSGLDSRSAFVVMESLQKLCKQGMTVASVIHQPRTDIYAMFDSLFLLGVGGHTVYHGPAMEAREYFEKIGFSLRAGDSQADWFLDISSGDVDSRDVELTNGISLPGRSFESTQEREKLIGGKGHHSNEGSDLRKAEQNREKLYKQWSKHFENMDSARKEFYYMAPSPSNLPTPVVSVSVWRQLIVFIRRNALLSWRNRYSRLIDFGIVIVAVFAITMLAGVKPSSFDSNPTSLLWIKFIASAKDASDFLQSLIFFYAFQGLNALSNYAMMVGLILSVLLGLNATKTITNNKLEFFRECQSGVSVTAFYVAASLTATVEQGLAAIIGAVISFLVMSPRSPFLVYLWNFFLISWLSVSWALLLAIIVPLQSVSTVVGFFNAFFGLLFCGKVTPGLYTSLYSNEALAVFAGFFSPLRFFVEGLCVSEAKCFPIQSGYTVAPDAFNFEMFKSSYSYWYDLTYMAHTNTEEAVVHDCQGWFWWVPASFAVGFTIRVAGCIAINISDRSKQGKKSIREEVAGDSAHAMSFIFQGILVLILFAGLFVLSSWLILRNFPAELESEGQV